MTPGPSITFDTGKIFGDLAFPLVGLGNLFIVMSARDSEYRAFAGAWNGAEWRDSHIVSTTYLSFTTKPAHFLLHRPDHVATSVPH